METQRHRFYASCREVLSRKALAPADSVEEIKRELGDLHREIKDKIGQDEYERIVPDLLAKRKHVDSYLEQLQAAGGKASGALPLNYNT